MARDVLCAARADARARRTHGSSKVVIQNVDMFGPRVGFLKFKADVEFNGVENIPGAP